LSDAATAGGKRVGAVITVGGQREQRDDVAAAALLDDTARRYTVIYDGDCAVCTRMVKVLDNWDRNRELEIIPSQAPGVSERFPWIPAHAYAESVQVIRASDDKTWQAGAALEELLKVLPKGRLVSWLFKVPFARPLADKFYWWFARNRYRMGCGEHCAMRATPQPLAGSEIAAGDRDSQHDRRRKQ
jgi:predicted DCC family thiol-disulfide oxidoreductase YuxK